MFKININISVFDKKYESKSYVLMLKSIKNV